MFTSTINFQTLPLVIPEVTQNAASEDCGLILLLFAQKLISHYGSFDLSTSISYKPQKTNDIFSFFQCSKEDIDQLRSEILRVMNLLSGEYEESASEFSNSERKIADSMNEH